jgi:hypothetical protein
MGTPARGAAGSEHVVQLFDGEDSMADAVAAFVEEGLLRSEPSLVVIARDHWVELGARLRASAVAVEALEASGQLTILDSGDTLKRFMRRGRPDRELFDRSIGALVRQLASRGSRLRVFGEMVDLLAAEGDFRSMHQLEDLWNDVCERESITLFCGYSAANFGNSRTMEALRQVCRAHSRVRSNPRDLLGSFLI